MFKYLKKENINIFVPNMDSFKYDDKFPILNNKENC